MAAENDREERAVSKSDLSSGVKLSAGHAVLLIVTDACAAKPGAAASKSKPGQPSAR